MKFDPISSRALAERILVLEFSKKIKDRETFAKAAGVTFSGVTAKDGYGQKLSRWINHPSEKFLLLGEENYKKLATYTLALHPYMAAQIGIPVFQLLENPLYHAIAPVLNCQARGAARETITEKMLGVYNVYRPSMRKKNFGYIGAMSINHDPQSGAFTTRELYVRHEDQQWDIAGALYPINKDVFMIISVDTNDDTVQMTYVNSISTDRNRKITTFAGWMCDMDRHKYYTAPIYFKKLDNVEKIEDVTISFDLIENMPNYAVEWFESKLSDETERGEYLYTEL